MTQFSRKMAAGSRMHELLLAPGQEKQVAEWTSALRDTGRWSGEVDFVRLDRSVFPVRMSVDTVQGAVGDAARFACVFSDISQARAHERELDRIAQYDMLTGVPNRRLLGERLTQAMQHSRETARKLALCYIDLDGFKPINDVYGHHIGDCVLTEVAQRLLLQLRNSVRTNQDEGMPSPDQQPDMLARLGGDEFVMLLGGLRDEHECHQAVQRVLGVISRAYHINGITPECVGQHWGDDIPG